MKAFHNHIVRVQEPTNLDELIAALERKLALGEATNAGATAAVSKLTMTS